MPTKKTDIAWLAGIIDGEGSIMFNPNHRSGYHLCRLQVTNTDSAILNGVRRILDEWLVFYSIHEQPLSYVGKKPCFVIEVNRQAEIKFVLEKICPYLKSAKHGKVSLFLAFIKQLTIDGRRKNRRKKILQYGMHL